MKPFGKFLTDLLADYAITKKILLGWDISLMEKSKQRNFNLKLCSYVAQMIFRVL